jgi:hypothetical protein
MFGIPQSVTVGWRSADDDDSRLIRKFNNWVNWPFSFFFFFFFWGGPRKIPLKSYLQEKFPSISFFEIVLSWGMIIMGNFLFPKRTVKKKKKMQYLAKSVRK